MTSCDTNVLYAALCPNSLGHETARALLDSFRGRRDFLLCEQVLLETYCLLRNPALHGRPLSAPEAAAVIARIRSNADWPIVDVPERGSPMNEVWRAAAVPGFAFRRVFDLRLGWTLRRWGVDTFYTRNRKDFRDCGFTMLVDPFED